MPPLRTIFKKEIIAEFVVPKKDSKRVIIVMDGMPSVPAKRSLLEFYAKKGFWVFHPRFRGSWESKGKFLRKSPHHDILDMIGELPRGFKDLWSGKIFKLNPRKLFLFGGSFSGPAALLCAPDPRVTKVVIAAPVIDWRVESRIEPLSKLERFVRAAFGEGYRFTKKDWQKLKSGKFYNPWVEQERIPGEKILIFHAQDDDVVPYRPTLRFAENTGSKLILFKRGGHFGSGSLMKPKFYNYVRSFLAKAAERR